MRFTGCPTTVDYNVDVNDSRIRVHFNDSHEHIFNINMKKKFNFFYYSVFWKQPYLALIFQEFNWFTFTLTLQQKKIVSVVWVNKKNSTFIMHTANFVDHEYS